MAIGKAATSLRGEPTSEGGDGGGGLDADDVVEDDADDDELEDDDEDSFESYLRMGLGGEGNSSQFTQPSLGLVWGC